MHRPVQRPVGESRFAQTGVVIGDYTDRLRPRIIRGELQALLEPALKAGLQRVVLVRAHRLVHGGGCRPSELRVQGLPGKPGAGDLTGIDVYGRIHIGGPRRHVTSLG